jgi:hypothetical protein
LLVLPTPELADPAVLLDTLGRLAPGRA